MTAVVLDNLALLCTAPGGAPALRGLILELAMCGALTAREADELPAPLPSAPMPALGQSISLPTSWAWVRLDQIALKVTDGTHHSPPNGIRGDFRYISAKNIKPWGIDLTDVTFVTTEVHEQIFARCDPALGDVLYIKDGATTGIVTINTLAEPFSMLSSVALIKPGNFVYNRFLLLAMQAPAFYRAMREDMTGVAITRVTLSKLKAAKLPLPPLAEQHRIVAKVDELMALCDRLEARQQDAEAAHARLVQALLDSLTQARDAEEFQACWQRLAGQFDLLLIRDESIDALKQVVLSLAIAGQLTEAASVDGKAGAELAKHRIASKGHARKGWASAALGDLGAVLGGATPSKARPDFWVGPIPWVSPKDMKRPEISDAEDHVSAAALDSSPLKLVPANSILMVVRGMILAHSFPVARTLAPVTINQDMKALVPPAELVPYLLLALQALKPQIVAMVDRSSHGTCKLVSEKLWSLEIGIPPLAEQHRIVAKVTELLALCDQLKARIAAANAKHAQLAEALVAQAVAA